MADGDPPDPKQTSLEQFEATKLELETLKKEKAEAEQQAKLKAEEKKRKELNSQKKELEQEVEELRKWKEDFVLKQEASKKEEILSQLSKKLAEEHKEKSLDDLNHILIGFKASGSDMPERGGNPPPAEIKGVGNYDDATGTYI